MTAHVTGALFGIAFLSRFIRASTSGFGIALSKMSASSSRSAGMPNLVSATSACELESPSLPALPPPVIGIPGIVSGGILYSRCMSNGPLPAPPADLWVVGSAQVASEPEEDMRARTACACRGTVLESFAPSRNAGIRPAWISIFGAPRFSVAASSGAADRDTSMMSRTMTAGFGGGAAQHGGAANRALTAA